jgi:hypothetical protein
MHSLFHYLIRFILVLCLTGAAIAQENQPVTAQRAPLTITASASGERVRFTAPSSVVQIHLQVYSDAGQVMFDASSKGNVLDWTVQDGSGARLQASTYLCVVTVKSLAGKLSQKIAELAVEEQQTELRTVEAAQMTAAQQREVGPVEEDAAIAILKENDGEAATVIAHNGEDGQIARGKGALSFRIGDFYSGKDTEQMRLTPEGNLGIGITHPLVRLDVDGLVRASQGIVFPDGSIQYSAATKTLGAKSSLPDPSFQSLQSKSGKGGQEHIDAAGTGTLNFIPKWQETGGSGTLQNSSVFDDGFNLGVGTSSPGGVFDLQRVSSSDLLQRFWNTGTGGAKLRYVASVGATSQIQLTDLNEWLMSIAGNNSIGLQFRVRDVGDANDEATLAARPRMSIIRNGNVGIGTTNPGTKLDIQGTVSTFNGVALALTNFNGGNTNPWVLGTGGRDVRKDAFSIGDNSGYKMTIFPNGFVGIGTITPAAALDVRGDIKLGTTGQYLAAGGEENLRIIRGVISASGNIIVGSGFHVSHTANPFQYNITFDTPFSAAPAVTGTVDFGFGSSVGFVMTQGVTGSLAKLILCESATSTDIGCTTYESAFHFIAIGPK